MIKLKFASYKRTTLEENIFSLLSFNQTRLINEESLVNEDID